MVISPRFERGTHSLEGCCSIQLSYETISVLFLIRLINYGKFFFHRRDTPAHQEPFARYY